MIRSFVRARRIVVFRHTTIVSLFVSAILFLMLPQSVIAQESGSKKTDSPGMTRQVAHFIVTTKESDIAAEAYEHAKLAVLDWLGVTLAGSKDPLVKKLVDFTDSVGGIPQSSVLGYNIKKSVTQAALINGAASHALDFDDTHSVFRGHPSASIVASITGASVILEGPNGLLEVLGGSVNEGALAVMGQDWGLTELSVKYHASCHWTHGANETVLQIAERDGVKAADIESVDEDISGLNPSGGLQHRRELLITVAQKPVSLYMGEVWD